MRAKLKFLALVGVVAAGFATAIATGASRSPAEIVENFKLSDVKGISHELREQKSAKAVLLFVAGNGCPIVRQSIRELQEMRNEFEKRGVVFWLVNSNFQDDVASIREEASEFSIDLPILKDEGQALARKLHINRTAEAILIRTSDWSVIYRGAVSDRLGYGTQKVRDVTPFLRNAITNFLAGKKVSPARTDVRGCAITFGK